MATIAVSEIEPGMVLEDDLRDRNGRFLLAKGEKLASKHIKVMKTWGVVEADIEGVTEQDLDNKKSEKIAPEIMKMAEGYTQKRFLHNDLKHEPVRHLFNICVLQKAEELSKKSHLPKVELPELSSSEKTHQFPKDSTKQKVDLQKLIQKQIKLPTLPVIFNQINEAISDPRCSATHIANIISKDASLSARLLQLVNSAFYNFPSKIDTISRAVAIIGTKQLSTLSMGTSVLTVFKDLPGELIDMNSFWQHSIACGIIARIISSYSHNTLTERFFVAGLLHDIGRLVILQSQPNKAKDAILYAKNNNCLLQETEKALIGFDHAQVGGVLFKQWKLPMILEKAVRYHHSHQQSQLQLDTAVVHLADFITNASNIGSSGERLVPRLNMKAWDEVNISTNTLSAAIKQAEHHIQETSEIFFQNG